MKVSSTKKGSVRTLVVDGRLDTLTSPELQKEVKAQLPGCEKMIFDLTNVEFISSTGLRVLVFAQRELVNKDGVVLRGMNPEVRKIIEITRLNTVFKIEK